MTATATGPAKLSLLEQLGADGIVMDGLDAVSVGEAVATARPDAIVHQMTALSAAHALLIGGLSADPPSKTTKTVGQDAAGKTRGSIGTSIPGAGNVNLDPLFDRERRLEEIETQRTSLFNRIEALSQHPWGKSRT